MSAAMTRLDNIATRQRSSRTRSLVFAAFLALAAVVSISTVHTVAAQTQSHVAAR